MSISNNSQENDKIKINTNKIVEGDIKNLLSKFKKNKIKFAFQLFNQILKTISPN